MRLPAIAVLAATALAGCAAEGMRASVWRGSPADRPVTCPLRNVPPVM